MPESLCQTIATSCAAAAMVIAACAPIDLTATSAPEETVAVSEVPTPTSVPATAQRMWRGIVVADEHRCSPYDAGDYRYSQSVENRIVSGIGGIVYGPYTGTHFASTDETDIEHIVARSEAHDSGLCNADQSTRRRFASDLLNLTLASPGVNRNQKGADDVSEWLPALNECWYVDRTVRVRQKYGLTIDQTEADAAEAVLSACDSFEMVIVDVPAPVPAETPEADSVPGVDALAMWDDNGNGRITCKEVRAHGIAPVHRDHPAYEFMDDRDDDGIVCE